MAAVIEEKDVPVSPWNDTGACLPNDGDLVLVCDRHGVYHVVSYIDGRWETMELRPVDVVYWAELPGPPV
ncbi:MAG: hypothetical protein IT495_19095 [Gammaproteobacteria bacterium]|nr:hypothetical protein [Gammaproteobacteria bacterium]